MTTSISTRSGKPATTSFRTSIAATTIDLSTIDARIGGGNQAFHFIGTHAFTRHAGELRFTDQGATCLVQGDVNGDGRADFDILVKAATLHQGDFVL